MLILFIFSSCRVSSFIHSPSTKYFFTIYMWWCLVVGTCVLMIHLPYLSPTSTYLLCRYTAAVGCHSHRCLMLELGMVAANIVAVAADRQSWTSDSPWLSEPDLWQLLSVGAGLSWPSDSTWLMLTPPGVLILSNSNMPHGTLRIESSRKKIP